MLHNPTQPPLTGALLDRAAHLRDDPEALARMRADPDARTIVFGGEKPLFRVNGDGIALEWLPVEPGHDAIFLGLADGKPRYATLTEEGERPDSCKFIDFRSALLGGDFAGNEATVASIGKALTGWHLTHPHCARCGAKSAMAQGGWRRDCPSCGAMHFPRTDPVVIMIVEREGRVALARNVNFPENMFSLIAGFVEPGESIEEAVRRESLEELGLVVDRVAYASSQPWPFPASLMLGCIGETRDEAFTLEEAEIADARWLNREQVSALFRGGIEDMAAPRAGAIASTLLKDWLERRIGYS